MSVPEFPCRHGQAEGIKRKDCAWLCPGPGAREEVHHQPGVQKKPAQADESLEGDSTQMSGEIPGPASLPQTLPVTTRFPIG